MMRRIAMLTSATMVCLTGMSARAQDISVTIDSIVADDHIKGTVGGIKPPLNAQQYCIVVYVHTDMWYIHPFANGDMGQSWAEIENGKEWEIPTVKRDFPADMVAAVVLARNAPNQCTAPAKTANVNNLARRQGIIVKSLKGTDEYGRL
jgi:hypothetical protein